MFRANALFHLPRYSGGGWEGVFPLAKIPSRSAPLPNSPPEIPGEGEIPSDTCDCLEPPPAMVCSLFQ
jgi:hypothetical protein